MWARARRCRGGRQTFVEREDVLLTGSKDGHVRAWDLATQHCFQTLAGAHGEARAPHASAPRLAQQRAGLKQHTLFVQAAALHRACARASSGAAIIPCLRLARPRRR